MTGPAFAEISFAARLKHERRLRGVSQEELAAQAGYTSAYISMLERGERAPTAATAELLAAALDLESAPRAALLDAAKRAHDQRATPIGSLPADLPLVIGGFLGAAPESALIARAEEMVTLDAALTSALRGEGRLVTLAGEPGVGKTRLAQEIALRARESGAILAVGRCYEPIRAAPLAPFIEALAALSAAASPALRAAIPGHWPLLTPLLPSSAPPATRAAPNQSTDSADSTDSTAFTSDHPAQTGPETQMALFWQVTAFVRAVAAERPVALLLDDLHWADEASLQLLSHLARQTRDARALLLGAYRDTETRGQRPLRDALRDLRREGLLDAVSLHSLDLPAALALITDQLAPHNAEHATISPDLVERLYATAGGLPLYLRGSLRTLLDRGDLCVRDGVWRLRAGGALVIPESVRDAVSEQVERLSPATQTALRAASALGQVFARAPLLRVSALGEAEFDAALEEALLAGLLQEEASRTVYSAEYGFNHALTQRAIYEAISPPSRRQLHRAAGAALEALPEPQRARRAAEIAQHFLDGDAIARALPHTLAACEYATKLCAWSEVERHTQLAAELARELNEPASEALALERGAFALVSMARYDEAIAAYSAASALHRAAGDLDKLAWTTAYAVRPTVIIGRAAEGLAELRSLIVTLATVADEATPEARRARFRALAFAPTAEAPDRSPEEWDHLAARAATVVSLRSAGRMYLSLSVYLQFLWRPHEAIPLAETAITLARQAADPLVLLRALHFYAEATWALGRMPEAIAALQETRDTAQAVNDLEGIIQGAGNLSEILQRRGDFLRARAQAAIAMAAAERYGVPEFAIETPVSSGVLAFYSGEWDEARRHLAHAQEVARSFGSSISNIVMAFEGRFALATDRRDDQRERTRARMERIVEEAEREHDVALLYFIQPALAEAELLAGQAEAARARMRHMAAQPGADIPDALPIKPLLAWAEAETGDLDRADTLLADCVARATSAQHQLALVDAYRVRALLEIRRERWREATDALEQSLALARPMPYPYAVAKALSVYGQLHEARGEQEPARARYTEALAILDALGERPYAACVTEALTRLP